MSIDIIQNSLYILYRLIYSLLFFYNLPLTTSSHHSSLFNHFHNFLFITLCLYFLLFIIVIELELTGVGLDLVSAWLSTFVLLVWVVVVLYH